MLAKRKYEGYLFVVSDFVKLIKKTLTIWNDKELWDELNLVSHGEDFEENEIWEDSITFNLEQI